MTTVISDSPPPAPMPGLRLIDQFERGLDAPICLTWELTYACNLGVRALPVPRGGGTRAS